MQRATITSTTLQTCGVKLWPKFAESEPVPYSAIRREFQVKLCVDFDGTIVDHRFPDIGTPVPGAIFWMKKWQRAGAKLILFTMRSNHRGEASPEFPDVKGGDYLNHAVEYCRERGVEFWGINTNPQQGSWTSSPKAYGDLYIDAAAFGCPLRQNPRMGGRPYVDWDIVGPAVLALVEAKK